MLALTICTSGRVSHKKLCNSAADDGSVFGSDTNSCGWGKRWRRRGAEEGDRSGFPLKNWPHAKFPITGKEEENLGTSPKA